MKFSCDIPAEGLKCTFTFPDSVTISQQQANHMAKVIIGEQDVNVAGDFFGYYAVLDEYPPDDEDSVMTRLLKTAEKNIGVLLETTDENRWFLAVFENKTQRDKALKVLNTECAHLFSAVFDACISVKASTA